MSALVKRVGVPFRWSARDGLGPNGKLMARSYGTELEGVFARAGVARAVDSNGVLTVVAHSVPRFSREGGLQALLIETGSTNLCRESQQFDDANWGKAPSVTVAANVAIAPDGTLTADRLDHDGVGASHGAARLCVFTGDGEKSMSIYLKAGTAAFTEIAVHDSTAAITRHRARLTWATLAVTTTLGSGTLYTLEALANGWYRLMASVPGVIAANSNSLFVYPVGTVPSGAGNVYAWGAQVENVLVPTSYIPTTTATASRVYDRLYFPFRLSPRECTVYVRGFERMDPSRSGLSNNYALLHVGATLVDPNFYLFRELSSAAGYKFVHDNAATMESPAVGAAVTYGDTVELRGVLSSTGTALVGCSENGAIEEVSAASAATALGSAWSALTLEVGAFENSPSTFQGSFAFTHICVALGTRSMAEMRALAEVD